VLQGNELMAVNDPVASEGVEEDSLATKAAEWHCD